MNALRCMGIAQWRMAFCERGETCMDACGKRRRIRRAHMRKEGPIRRPGERAKERILVNETICEQRLRGFYTRLVSERNGATQQRGRNTIFNEECKLSRNGRETIQLSMRPLRKIDLTVQCHERYPTKCQNQTWP